MLAVIYEDASYGDLIFYLRFVHNGKVFQIEVFRRGELLEQMHATGQAPLVRIGNRRMERIQSAPEWKESIQVHPALKDSTARFPTAG